MNKNKIPESTKILGNCIIDDETIIGENCVIENTKLIGAVIGNKVKIENSIIEKSQIKDNVSIGPFARIRPLTIIEKDARIGNFVEIKNSKIGERTKVPHLSYIGDSEIGKDVNVGCGVIFCNYDGQNKNKTIVGDRVFIGSNSNLIAPLVLENESFIAAGTTVNKSVGEGEFCIGRAKNEIKHGMLNLYAQNFNSPLKFFGTDGIRGIYGKDLTDELAVQVGYAITRLCKNAKVLIGRDTRTNGEILQNNLAKGLCSGNAKVYSCGIIATPGVAYLTRIFDFDYGVVITASHNPSEYNGIKIFNKKGYKIDINEEFLLEKALKMPNFIKKVEINKIEVDAYLTKLKSICRHKFTDKTIYIDCANGAVSSYAKMIFENAGVKVIAQNTDGEINKNASVLNKDIFIENMKNSNADIGFCFDGDADRIMCITKSLKVLDGDLILYILAKYLKDKCVVGTIMTNISLEKHLLKMGTRLLRTPVGDRNIAKVIGKKYNIGAEQSGHIIIRKYSTTGDGIITALELLNVLYEKPNYFNDAENLFMFPTVSLTVKTDNKKVIKNSFVQDEIIRQEKIVGDAGRIIVRASGTEPKIRITVEMKSLAKATQVAQIIKSTIENNL